MFYLSLGYIHLFFNLLNFYAVTRFLVTQLLVTALLCLVTNIPHCVFLFGRHWGMTGFYTGINKEKACHQQQQIRPTHNDEVSGPNTGVGDKRVVSVLNHMLLSLCSITHVSYVKQETVLFLLSWQTGNFRGLRTNNVDRHARKHTLPKTPLLVNQLRSHNVYMWKLCNPAPVKKIMVRQLKS